MTEDFYLAAVPEPVTILGLRLRPLSLGHIILLHRFDSFFVTGKGSPGFDDLALSVLVCSLTYSEGQSLPQQDDADLAMRLWHDRLTGSRRLLVRLGFRKARLINLSKECERFYEYVQEHSKVPYYSFTPTDFREMQCPPVQAVKVRLMRDMHFTEAELLDRSWRLCLWDYITLKAIAGEVKMENQADIQAAQAAGEELAKAISEGRFKMTT